MDVNTIYKAVNTKNRQQAQDMGWGGGEKIKTKKNIKKQTQAGNKLRDAHLKTDKECA